MKKANMILDLANNKAEIYLQNKSEGHYSVALKETSVHIKNCFTVIETEEDIVRVIKKTPQTICSPL